LILECDRLEGASNFTPWNRKLQMILEKDKLWKHIEKVITTPNDLKLLALHNKEDKVKRIILDSVKDYLITHIIEKKIGKEMYNALVGLYQNSSVSRKMLLRNKISTIHMSKTDIVVSYLAKTTELRDQFTAIGTKVEDKELLPIALEGFAPSWKPFVQGVCARENLPIYDKL
jgi:hypothetical protein